MIEELKNDDAVRQVGGAFRFTALVQRRLKELIDGARPLVAPQGKTPVQIAVEEVAQGKIAIDYDRTEGITPPAEVDKRDEIHKAGFAEVELREPTDD